MTHITLEEYIQFKQMEQFLDSLVFSRPIPHFAPPNPQETRKNPLGLERLLSFLNAAGNPHTQNNYIHIAGTSGKTSTSYFLANLLQAQGYRTGLFISPHICTVAEYFTINMQLPAVNEMIALVEQAKPLIDSEYEQRDMGNISYFEFILALAVRYFHSRQTDYVVLEAGLGGRYDATNVIPRSEVSIMTSIGLDHTHILGDTLQEIAQDKVGILKQGTPLITAEQRPEILAIFEQEAGKFDTSVHILGQNFSIERVRISQEQTVFDYISERQRFQELTTSMRGMYQTHNAALAIRALELIAEKQGIQINEEYLRTGLSSTMTPARYEQVNLDPPVFLDGAHNPDKIKQFAFFLRHQFPKDQIIFVCGFTVGRHPEQMFAPLLDVSSDFYLTRVFTGYREPEDPLHLKSILLTLAPAASVTIRLDPFAALEAAIQQAQQQGKIVCVTGSLYLVSYLRQRWYPEHQMLAQGRLV